MGRERTFTVHPGFPVMARTPLLPAELNSPPGRALTGPLLEAVRFASRSLATVTDDDLDADERLATTVHAYDRRARTRATPRGSFAGVQVAQATNGPARFQIGAAHTARSAPSAAWLNDVADRLVETPELLARLRMTSNDLVARRGDRFEHEYAGAKKPERVTLRATQAVELILETCRTPTRLDTIASAINSRWPGVPAATVPATVLKMVRTGLLLTDLLPDDVAQDPLGNIIARVPATHELRPTLVALRDLLTEADKYPPGSPDRLAALTEARDLCDGVTRHENPIVVDVAVDADLQVPARLLADAADAAGLLWSITPAPVVMDGFHDRFLERYGTERRLPLLVVVDPVTGLGSPDDIEQPASAEDRTRAQVLAGLIAKAAADGTIEAVLDEVTATALRVSDGAVPPASGELYARVLARTPQDYAASRFDLAAYLGSTQEAGSTLGRFASLLDLPAPHHDDDGPLPAEVVVRPRLAALTTVALPSGFAPLRICVGVVPGPGDLTLSDLDLASDGEHLTLWSRRLDRQIIPALFSRIGSAYVPPAVRLLQDLANAGTRHWHTWVWGPLADAPFLPRIRWRRTILSPACWRLPHSLVRAVRDPSAWDDALDAWRSTTTPRPPRIVVVRDADQRLPLDLEDARDRDLLRRYVRRGTDIVTEEPGGADAVQAVAQGPAGRHILELVVPLKAREPRPDSARLRRPAVSTAPTVHFPGGPWLSLAIASPAAHHDDLLAQIRDFTTAIRDDVDRCFWLRYDNKAHGPHVRVRFAGDPAILNGKVLPAFSNQCTSWIAHGLTGQFVVEKYEPEVDRYGGSGAIERAERLFDADSELVLDLLNARPDIDTRLLLVAHSAVVLSRSLAQGDLTGIGRPRLDKTARRKVNGLRAIARSTAGRLLDDDAQDAWDRRTLAVAAYGDVLPAERRADCTSSVIHMHANRMGLGHDHERLARALAVELLAQVS